MMNICDKFHWNPSTKYRDVASRKQRTERWTNTGRPTGRTTQIHYTFRLPLV